MFLGNFFKSYYLSQSDKTLLFFLYSNSVKDYLSKLNLTAAPAYSYIYLLKIRLSYTVKSWVYTTNHKRIAINYFTFVFISGLAGMSLATVIRLEFAYPGVGILAGDSLQYLSIATAHGVIMVFFMIMPAIFGAFGNFLLPTQLGVHDVAFPRLNSAAFWFLPGGLIMLCQLVCVDRRYQRMNCFNIRELQSMLKRKYFTDLVNSNDHRELLNDTMIGYRYKTNMTSSVDPNIVSFYNFGTTFFNKNKEDSLVSIYSGEYLYSKSDFIYNNVFNYVYLVFYNVYELFNRLVLEMFFETEYQGLDKDWADMFFKHYYNSLLSSEDVLFGITIIIQNFSLISLTTIYNSILFFIDFTTLNLNWDANSIKINFLFDRSIKNISVDSVDYSTKNINITNSIVSNANEVSNLTRFTRFNNPIISYNYKSGNYIGLWTKLYPSLILSFIEVSKNVIKGPWFLSSDFTDRFNDNYKNFNTFFTNKLSVNVSDSSNWYMNHVQPIYNYFNFYHVLNDNTYLNSRWVSVNSINQKFHKMFTSSSTQQRVLANWRSLKFTREAWRCKLLAARHQNTMYRRSLGEDNLVWSIDRNAKDLLPGWAMVTPFSARTRYTNIGKTDIGLMGVLLVLNGSIVSSANFLVTYRYLSTLNNRKMRDARSFYSESLIVASWMMIAANPMLVIAIIMLLSDRHWQTSFFDYSGGGDTVLFQHMFWFFGHPEVYVIMIPIFGFANTILSFFLRKRVSARSSLMYSMYTIAFLGFFVWGHHMYMVGLAHTTRMLFSTLTVMISIPAATKLMHWCVTIVNSFFTMEIPLLWTLNFIFFFISGGVSGMCVAHTGMDVLFHDTFYVIGHFHVMIAGSGMMGIFAAFYFYFPAMYGVRYSRIYAYLHYTYYIIGQLLTVMPMMWLGYCGQPRRVLDYPSSFGGWHAISSAGHLLSVFAMLSFFLMIFDSVRQAKPTIRNNFGVGRFNTRLNFYLFEISRLRYIQRKGLYLHRFTKNYSNPKANMNTIDIYNLDSTLFSYTFFRKN